MGAQVETRGLPGVLQTLALPQVAHTEVEATVEVALLENPTLERIRGIHARNAVATP